MPHIERRIGYAIFVAAVLGAFPCHAVAQVQGTQPKQYPWSDESLSPDARADMVVKELTLDEKISLLHGNGMAFNTVGPTESNGGAGYSVSIPRLGIPAIQMADSAYGVTRGARSGRYSTALPNNLAAASSWDPQSAFEYGALIGRELRTQGYSMPLGGGVNLPREPRNGRTFEYQGEDPLLAGTLVGNLVKGVQSQNIIGDLKHYARQRPGERPERGQCEHRQALDARNRSAGLSDCTRYLRRRRRDVLLQSRERGLRLRK